MGPRPETNALAFADVEVPGDSSTAYDNGVLAVQRFLSLVQGCAADKMGRYYIIDLIGRTRAVMRTPVAEQTIHGPRTFLKIEFGQDKKVGFAHLPTDLLSALSASQVQRLVALSTAADAAPVEMSIVASLEALGEACKRHLPSTRMLLGSSALEMLVGSRSGDDVSFRGQTAAVAERATFLVSGGTTAQRRSFDKRLRDLYSKRSGVRHGSRPTISDDEIVALATIARDVALALLDRPDLRNGHQLDAWVQEMRYTTGPTPPAAPGFSAPAST